VRHLLLIQSAYNDGELSRRRLEITQHTVIPTLRAQTSAVEVVVAIHRADPHQAERRQVYEGCGQVVRFVEVDSWKLIGGNWDLPTGWKIVSRCDDDDCLSSDFCARLQAHATERRQCLQWPSGYVFWRQQIFFITHPGNQFVSLVTDLQETPHDYRHWEIVQQLPTVNVDSRPGWIWVRHGDTATSTIGKYRRKQVGRIDADRIPVNLRAIIRAAEASGQPSANYESHRSPHWQQVRRENRKAPAISLRPSDALAVEGSDKVSVHNYGAFYDGLWSVLQPRVVVEVGALRGASLRAWQRCGARAIGMDKTPPPGVECVRATVPDFAPLLERLQGLQVDLVIDDASHTLEHQQATYAALWPALRPGGVLVIEDLQDYAARLHFAGRGFAVEDWSTDTGRWDDAIAWKTR